MVLSSWPILPFLYQISFSFSFCFVFPFGVTECVRVCERMRVLGLLSGGKDSVYSLMCAVRAGHTLVGVAHIAAQRAGTEVDSYMYQTVGSEAAAGVAECLGVPFFSAVRAGDAVTQALEYGAAAVPGDEVEAMHALLRDVRERHGVAFDAVVSGAILSTYQKTRVESVCARLGVASLAPLWQRDQAELLAAMVRDGLVAVLVILVVLGASIPAIRYLLRLNAAEVLHGR